ncbi:MAG: hypothetical protein K9M45_01590 [Kiritimatiellales bacterium]|nr:hypothetical protein [Kiritimatiellales bacterium]
MRGVKVLSIDGVGVTIRLYGKIYLLEYFHFPWFKHCTEKEIRTVDVSGTGVDWPLAEISLGLDSIQHPEQYRTSPTEKQWLEITGRAKPPVRGKNGRFISRKKEKTAV